MLAVPGAIFSRLQLRRHRRQKAVRAQIQRPTE